MYKWTIVQSRGEDFEGLDYFGADHVLPEEISCPLLGYIEAVTLIGRAIVGFVPVGKLLELWVIDCGHGPPMSVFALSGNTEIMAKLDCFRVCMSI